MAFRSFLAGILQYNNINFNFNFSEVFIYLLSHIFRTLIRCEATRSFSRNKNLEKYTYSLNYLLIIHFGFFSLFHQTGVIIFTWLCAVSLQLQTTPAIDYLPCNQCFSCFFNWTSLLKFSQKSPTVDPFNLNPLILWVGFSYSNNFTLSFLVDLFFQKLKNQDLCVDYVCYLDSRHITF